MYALLLFLVVVVSPIFLAGFAVGYFAGKRRARAERVQSQPVPAYPPYPVYPSYPSNTAVRPGPVTDPAGSVRGPAPFFSEHVSAEPVVTTPVESAPTPAQAPAPVDVQAPLVAPAPAAPAITPPVVVPPQAHDPQEEARRREIRNVTVGLFAAALLVIAAGALLLTSTLPGALKTVLLIAATGGFYGSGLTVLRRRPMLRTAAVGFVGIGLALVPLVGVGLHRWLLPGNGSLAALLASAAGLLLYSFAAVRLSSRVLGYLSVLSVLSFGVSFGMSLQRGVLATLCVLIVLSTLVKLSLLRPQLRIPAVLRQAFGDLGPWYTPLLAVTTAACVLLRGVNLREFAVALTLLGTHSAVAFALGRRWDDLAGVRFAVVAVPLIWLWSADAPLGLLSLTATLLAALHAAAFTRDDVARRAAPWWPERLTESRALPLLWAGVATASAVPALFGQGLWGSFTAAVLAAVLLFLGVAEGRRRLPLLAVAGLLSLALPAAVPWAEALGGAQRAL